MKSITSVSGGKTSAYCAANYPTDYYLFALVRTNDKSCLYPDKKLRQDVEDRIQQPFIGTLEDDEIIHTMFDLEQYLGHKINWVTGLAFEDVIKSKGGYLANKMTRYCTTQMKLVPMFYWWAEEIGEPVIMNIGYRANEKNRVLKMQDRCNPDGLIEMKATFEKHDNGNNKWEMVPWQKPGFPIYEDGIYKDTIEEYWKDKPVRFARYNNCVGCFHRNPLMLKKMFDTHPNKMAWFEKQEKSGKGTWRSDVRYSKIRKSELQIELSWDDFDECDSGFCEIN